MPPLIDHTTSLGKGIQRTLDSLTEEEALAIAEWDHRQYAAIAAKESAPPSEPKP